MKRWLLVGLLLWVPVLVFSQAKPVSYSTIDWTVQSVDADNLDTLAQRLTAPYSSDREKVRSIFRWITEHIAYKTVKPLYSKRSARVSYEETEDTSTVLKPLNVRVAENVLKKREAVCDGYARLFKAMCDYAGIRAEIITGYARTNINRVGVRFISNHSWNAVYVDSSWQLLDATWASGFISYQGDQFVKRYDDYYFLTPPHLFIRDHYPDNLQWALLVDPPTMQEYRHTPFKSQAFVKNRVLSFRPAKGVIEAKVGDTVEVELEIAYIDQEVVVPDEHGVDPTLVPLEKLLAISPTIEGKKLRYTYAIESPAVEWLNLMYRDEVMMRYRLEIKDPEDAGERVVIK